jgi:hypothetical protein
MGAKGLVVNVWDQGRGGESGNFSHQVIQIAGVVSILLSPSSSSMHIRLVDQVEWSLECVR